VLLVKFLVLFFLYGTALILDIIFAMRNKFIGNRTALHLAGNLPFMVASFTLTTHWHWHWHWQHIDIDNTL